MDHFFPLEAGERASELVEDYQFETNMLKIPDDNDGMFDFAAVWPCPSWSNEDSYNFFVLSWLIGNSSSFVSGGPGRGMHSRAPKSTLVSFLTQFSHQFSIWDRGCDHSYADLQEFGIVWTSP